MTVLSNRLHLTLLALWLTSNFSAAERRPFTQYVAHDGGNDVLMHSQDGRLRTPGSIDLSNLTFSVAKRSAANFTLEVVVFRQPPNYYGFDKTEQGVGVDYGPDREYYGRAWQFCCDEDAVEKGLCTSEQMYHIIIDDELFDGYYHSIAFGPDQSESKEWNFGELKFGKGKAGEVFEVAFHICDYEHGGDIKTSGSIVWKSSHGYLPANLFGLCYFWAVTAIIYVALLFFYGSRMMVISREEACRIIPVYIIITIALGTAELVLRTIDYLAWNASGDRDFFWMYLYSIMDSLNGGAIRCLLFVLCSGWFVVQERVSKIGLVAGHFLGVVYVYLSAKSGWIRVKFKQKYEWESVMALSGQEAKDSDTATTMALGVCIVDLIFMLLFLLSLSMTIVKARRNSQHFHLKRYRILGVVLLLTLVVETKMAHYFFFDRSGLHSQYEWLWKPAQEANCCIVITVVAVFWAPPSRVQRYQTAASNDEDGIVAATMGVNDLELELTAGQVDVFVH